MVWFLNIEARAHDDIIGEPILSQQPSISNPPTIQHSFNFSATVLTCDLLSYFVSLFSSSSYRSPGSASPNIVSYSQDVLNSLQLFVHCLRIPTWPNLVGQDSHTSLQKCSVKTTLSGCYSYIVNLQFSELTLQLYSACKCYDKNSETKLLHQFNAMIAVIHCKHARLKQPRVVSAVSVSPFAKYYMS